MGGLLGGISGMPPGFVGLTALAVFIAIKIAASALPRLVGGDTQ